jgi:hypothetical protein
MRALLVVDDAEAIEGALLGAQVALGRPRRGGFECPMHPLVGAVLLGAGGKDPLVLNAQAHPPYVELREPVDPGGRERDSLSVRMALGRPYSRKRRSKMGWTPTPLVDSNP